MSKRGRIPSSVELRKAITGKLDINLFFKQVASLPVSEQVSVKLKLMNFCVPRLAAVDITSTSITVEEFVLLNDSDQLSYMSNMNKNPPKN